MIRRERRKIIEDAYFTLNEPYKDRDHNNLKYEIDNLSRGGLRFCSHDIFTIDDLLSISVYINEQEIHSARCRICYFEHDNESNAGDYYGLSFIDKFMDMKFCNP